MELLKYDRLQVVIKGARSLPTLQLEISEKRGKMMRLVFIVASVAVLLAGCNKPAKSVEWYKTHEKERKARIAECKNNPGELRDDPDCINAIEAHRKSGFVPKGKPVSGLSQFDKF